MTPIREKVREAIVKAVPEKGDWRCPKSNCGKRSNEGGYCGYLGCEGFRKRADKPQEITLADVLIAVKKRRNELVGTDPQRFEEVEEWSEAFEQAEVDNELEFFWYYWNLSVSFDEQEDEVIEFLGKVLGV